MEVFTLVLYSGMAIDAKVKIPRRKGMGVIFGYLLELIVEIWRFEFFLFSKFGEFGPFFPMKNPLHWWKSHNFSGQILATIRQ